MEIQESMVLPAARDTEDMSPSPRRIRTVVALAAALALAIRGLQEGGLSRGWPYLLIAGAVLVAVGLKARLYR